MTASKIAKVEKVGERGVRFTFKQPDRELPLILGLFPVLPKHAIDADDVRQVDAEADDRQRTLPARHVARRRLARPSSAIPDYWAKDIPSKRGFDNYDTITLTYFRDENAMFEAFKKGLVDVFIDENSGRWASQYNFPAVTRGDIIKEAIKTRLPSGMLGIVMNTRRPVFQDREAARRADRPLRLRMGEPQPVLRRLYAHQELLRQFGALLAWQAGKRGGEGAACPLPRRGDAGDHGQRLDTAGLRRQRARPRLHARRLREAEGGRLRAEGRPHDRA